MKYTLTSPPVPHASILHCPICGIEVHRTLRGDLHPATEAEEACTAHLVDEHPFRYRLYLRTGWRWPIRGLLG